jgi:hypothetical protein
VRLRLLALCQLPLCCEMSWNEEEQHAQIKKMGHEAWNRKKKEGNFIYEQKREGTLGF